MEKLRRALPGGDTRPPECRSACAQYCDWPAAAALRLAPPEAPLLSIELLDPGSACLHHKKKPSGKILILNSVKTDLEAIAPDKVLASTILSLVPWNLSEYVKDPVVKTCERREVTVSRLTYSGPGSKSLYSRELQQACTK